jgi:hypothetical protein
MNKMWGGVVCALVALSNRAYCSSQDVNSHSFFSIRSPFQSASPERVTLFRDAPLLNCDGYQGGLQAVVIGGESTNPKALARYFLPFDKDTLIFANDNAPGSTIGGLDNPNFRDVNAFFFNIQTVANDFKSTVKFSPRHTYVGLGLDWKQYVGSCECGPKRWWLEISFPILHVRNEIKCIETVQNQGVAGAFLGDDLGNPPVGANAVNTSVCEAFKGLKPFFVGAASGGAVTGSGFKFGKIDGAQSKTGLADIEFKVGYDFAQEEYYHGDLYVGVVIPTGNKPKGEFVFEPIVGNNRHFALMWGGSFGYKLWRSCDDVQDLRVEFEINGRYLFRNTQTRSFDLVDKSWSRYMLVYRTFANSQNVTPEEGINVFTQKLHITPRYAQDFNFGLVYDICNWQAEIGYNFWARQSEKVKLKEPFSTTITFPEVSASIISADTINRAITIKENFAGANLSLGGSESLYNLNAWQQSDLNLHSAVAPCAISHIVYGSLGSYSDHWCDCWSLFAGMGGSYEFSSVNTAINRWMVWAKVGVSM